MAGRGTDILLGGNPEFPWREQLKRQEIDPEEAHAEQFEEAMRDVLPLTVAEHEESCGSVVFISLAPSVTSRGESTTSFAGVPAVRATRVHRDFTSRSKTT
jgi:preprotein translocase subunit SecA